MDKLRRHLNDFQDAARQIELAQVAIDVMEKMNTRAATAAIRILKRGQQPLLKRLDAAAAKLGAPYPKATNATDEALKGKP